MSDPSISLGGRRFYDQTTAYCNPITSTSYKIDFVFTSPELSFISDAEGPLTVLMWVDELGDIQVKLTTRTFYSLQMRAVEATFDRQKHTFCIPAWMIQLTGKNSPAPNGLEFASGKYGVRFAVGDFDNEQHADGESRTKILRRID